MAINIILQEAPTGSTIFNSTSAYTQNVFAGYNLTLPDTPIFSTLSGFTDSTPSVSTGYTIADVVYTDSDGSTGNTAEYGSTIVCTPVQQPLQANIVAYADSGTTSAITSTNYGDTVYLKIHTTGATAIENYTFQIPEYDNGYREINQTGDTYAWETDRYGEWNISARVKDTGTPTAYDVNPMRFMTRPPTQYWDKPVDYLDLPAITGGTTTEVMNLLVAVFDRENNYLAMDIEGDYTVDWGDGTVENFSSGVQANHNYTYSGISSATTTSEGFRQVLVEVTPQGGSNLTSIDFNVQHSAVTSTNYSTGILDVGMQATGCTAFEMGDSSHQVYHRHLKRFNWIGTNGVTNFDLAFDECISLEECHLSFDSALSILRIFADCNSLVNVNDGVLDLPSATTFRIPFENCKSLEWIKSIDAPLVNDCDGVFTSCSSLKGVEYINLSGSTDFSGFYVNCQGLVYAPMMDTSNATNMTSMHSTNRNLRYIPEYNTSGVTSFASFATTCTSLMKMPWLDLQSATNINNMVDTCSALVEFPEYNTSSVTQARTVFRNAYSINRIPALNLPICTDFTNFASGAYGITEIDPDFYAPLADNLQTAFNATFSLREFPPIFSGNPLDNISSMFATTKIKSIPEGTLNTSGVTNMQFMFQSSIVEDVQIIDCGSSTSLYRMFFLNEGIKVLDFLTNTENVTNFRGLVRDCPTVTEISGINWSAATNMTNTFQNAYNLSRIVGGNIPITFTIANCNFDAREIDELFTDLPTVVGQTVTVTGNPGVAGCDPTIATAKGWNVNT